MLKTFRQNINGNVHISNKNLKDNQILPLSFENVHVEMINGNRLDELYLNLVYKDDPLTTVNTRLEFHEPLTVDNIQLNAEFDGVNVNGLINQVQLYQNVSNYSDHLEHMSIIGSGIIEELTSMFYSML